MASFSRSSLTIQLTFLLLVRDLRMCSFQKIGVGGRGLSTKPQKPVSTFVQVTGGRTLTLNCTLTQMDLPTSARWYKESSSNVWTLIYKESDPNSRGVRLVPGSRTDFSISLSNMGPEDNGTYRCQMIKKVLQLGESSIKKEVAVYVTVPPTVRLETTPPSPVQLNASVTVTCKAEYYYPNVAKVGLFCKNPSGKGMSTGATLNSNRTYSLQSSLKIVATQNWNSSLFTCLVKHNSTVFKATARLITAELGDGSLQQSMMCLYLGLFLNKISLFLFFVGLFRIKMRGCCIARLFAPSSQG